VNTASAARDVWREERGGNIRKDQNAADTHSAAGHFKRVLPIPGGTCAKAPDIELFDEAE